VVIEGKFERKSCITIKRPFDVAVTGTGNERIIAVVDRDSHQIQIWRDRDYNLSVVQTIGCGTVGNRPHQLHSPQGVEMNNDDLYVSENQNHRIQVFNIHTGVCMRTIGDNEQMPYPSGLTIRHDEIFVVGGDCSQVISVWDRRDGRHLRQWEQKANVPECGTPFACLANEGNKEALFVTYPTGNVVHIFHPRTGVLLRKIRPVHFPSGIVVNNTKTHVYVAEESKSRIAIFSIRNGELIKTFGSYGSSNGQFAFPKGITITDDDRLLVADAEERIQWFR